MFHRYFRGIGDGWAGWAIPHLDFGRSVNQRGQIVPPTLILSQPAFVSFCEKAGLYNKNAGTWGAEGGGGARPPQFLLHQSTLS